MNYNCKSKIRGKKNLDFVFCEIPRDAVFQRIKYLKTNNALRYFDLFGNGMFSRAEIASLNTVGSRSRDLQRKFNDLTVKSIEHFEFVMRTIKWCMTRRVWKVCNCQENLRGNWCSISSPSDGDLFSKTSHTSRSIAKHVIVGSLRSVVDWVTRDCECE